MNINFTYVGIVLEIVVVLLCVGNAYYQFRKIHIDHKKFMSKLDREMDELRELRRTHTENTKTRNKRKKFDEEIEKLPKFGDFNEKFIFENKRHVLIEKTILYYNRKDNSIPKTKLLISCFSKWVDKMHKVVQEINQKEFDGFFIIELKDSDVFQDGVKHQSVFIKNP